MKQKTLFKILVLSIVLILTLLGANLPAYASITDTTNKGTITVSEIEAGVKVSIYKLTTVNYDYDADQPTAVPYTWDANVKTWIDANYADYSDPEDFYEAGATAEDVAKFYSELASAIKGGTVTLTAAEEKTATGTASYPVTAEKLTGEVEFTDCEMGTYLILIENGYMVYTPSVVNLTPEYDNINKEWKLTSPVEVEVKSTTPQITKTVADSAKANYSTKDEFAFTLIADVPSYLSGSTATNYYISDTLSNGLKLDNTSIKVYGIKGVAETELTTEAYTLTTENATRPNNLGEVTFGINFIYNKISSYEKVKVVYDATLNKTAETSLGSTGNANTAYLDYNNNPYDATNLQSQQSSNTIYTYGAEITKTDKATGASLTGAQFTLSDANGELYFVNVSGKYYQANSSDTGATNTLEVDSNGKLFLYGLDEGSYTLKETKAPEGYNISTTTSTITIADTDLDGAIEDGVGDDTDGATGIFTLNFPNSSGFQLPVTGGIGTTIFATCGVLFVGLGIILFVVFVRKSRQTK